MADEFERSSSPCTSCLVDGVCAEFVSGKGTARAGKRALEPHTLLTPAAPGAVTALMQIICLGEFFYSSAQKKKKKKKDTLNVMVKQVLMCPKTT